MNEKTPTYVLYIIYREREEAAFWGDLISHLACEVPKPIGGVLLTLAIYSYGF